MDNNNNFGSGSIEKELFEYIVKRFGDKNTILELGSGFGTGQLSLHFNMISIENDENWVGLYDSDYIYAPLKHDGFDMWYDVDAVRNGLDGRQYDLILIDGPVAYKKNQRNRRKGFFRHIELFDTNVPLIFDDIDRMNDMEHFNMVSEFLGRNKKIMRGNKKKFGIL